MGEGLFQPVHLLLIATIFLIVFGPGKLAGIGGALGKSVHDFKSSMGVGEDDESAPPAISAPAPSAEPASPPTGTAMRSSEL